MPTLSSTDIGYNTKSTLGSNTTLSSGSIYNVASVTLGVGVWLILGTLILTNTTGISTTTIIKLCISTTSGVVGHNGSSNLGKFTASSTVIESGINFIDTITVLKSVSTSTTFYFNIAAAFTGGGTLYANLTTTYIQAVRLA
jgi:hypothetical protein